MSNLTKRVISAVVAVVLLFLAAYYFGSAGIIVASMICSAIALYEYSSLIYTALGFNNIFRLGFLASAVAIYAVTVYDLAKLPLVMALVVVLLCSILLLAIKSDEDLPKVLNLQSMSVLGLIYCGIFPAMVVKLIQLPEGWRYFVSLLVIVFCSDTSAYFSGISFGKKKLFPQVSPKKTRVGAVGGVVGASVGGLIIGHYLLPEIPMLNMVIFALITSIAGEVGDLFESLIKRVAGVKDSGSIMPGHGGFLDRLDGIYFAAPVFYALLQLQW